MEKLTQHVDKTLETFVTDLPDNQYQAGYLAAFLEIREMIREVSEEQEVTVN